MRILIVNDSSADIIEAALMATADFKVEVDKATDGGAALKLYREHPGRYDVVITDIAHPGIDGLDLAKAILLSNPIQPLAFVTAAGVDGKIVPLCSFATDRWMLCMTGKKQSLAIELRDTLVLGEPYTFEQLITLVRACSRGKVPHTCVDFPNLGCAACDIDKVAEPEPTPK